MRGIHKVRIIATKEERNGIWVEVYTTLKLDRLALTLMPAVYALL